VIVYRLLCLSCVVAVVGCGGGSTKQLTKEEQKVETDKMMKGMPTLPGQLPASGDDPMKSMGMPATK
jgi:hypothetical protein